MPVKNEAEVKLVFNEKGHFISIKDKNGKKISSKRPSEFPSDPPCACPSGYYSLVINGRCYCIKL
jgi:hypothetical protein